MNRRNVLRISAMTVLGLVLVPSGGVAQQSTLKEQLVGVWTLVSSDFTPANGTKRQPFGANPKGILIIDAGGRYAQITARPDRPKFKTPGQATTEELAAAAREFGANFGTWSVSEADKTFTRHFEAALGPNNEGIDLKAPVSLGGDEMKIVETQPAGVRTDLYQRAK
jgi:hypothetical protein